MLQETDLIKTENGEELEDPEDLSELEDEEYEKDYEN